MLNYIAEAAQVGPIGDWLGALPLRSRKTEKDSLQAITESLLEQLSPAGNTFIFKRTIYSWFTMV
jgi:hypothetical protein